MPYLRANMLTARPLRRRSRRGFTAKIMMLAVLSLVFLVIMTVGVYLFFFDAVRGLEAHSRTGRAELEQIELHVHGLRISEAIEHLDLADAEFAAAQRDLFRLKVLAMVPGLRSTVVATDGLLTGSRS